MQTLAIDNLQEGLALAEKWKRISFAEKTLKDNGVKIWEKPFHTAGTLFRWKDKPVDYDILIFDGGAMSEDGNLVVKFPKTGDILNNKPILDEYALSCAVEYDSLDILEILGLSYYVKPFEIFKICLKKAWNHPDFTIILDKT